MRARQSRDLTRIPELARWIVRVADPDQRRARAVERHLGSLQLGDEPVERIRRGRDRRGAPGAEVGLGAQRDEIVRSRAGYDLLGGDAAVAGGGRAQLTVRAVRVLVQPREARRERHLRHAWKRRRVLVVAEHVLRAEPVASGHLL
jgi:hypothetical protein